MPIRKSNRMVLVSDSGHYLTTGFSRLDTFNPYAHPPPPPPPICQYDGTINDCHTSGRFDPPFSWEMPVPSREYDSCFLVSHLVMSIYMYRLFLYLVRS